MYSLLIDSHSNELNIVIYKDRVVERKKGIVFSNQSKIIVSTIIETLREINIDFKDLSEIIVVNGPGSFTGVRLGVTVAKTISYCLNIPIKSISTIKLLAINVDDSSEYSITISDQKGYYIGEFDSNKELIDYYFYINKQDFITYNNSHNIVDNINLDWNNVYKYNCLTEEDCYNIKPLYIKKIEVEK